MCYNTYMPKPTDPKVKLPKKPTLARLLRTPDLDPTVSLEYLRTQAEEHFDDFIILARRKNRDGYGLMWAASDKTWAKGALDRVLQDYVVTDSCNIEDRNRPE